MFILLIVFMAGGGNGIAVWSPPITYADEASCRQAGNTAKNDHTRAQVTFSCLPTTRTDKQP
ncbi:hypothetical protein [Vineibacter terrae]|uniref:Uncharacterized protein n=1 Tax=Vineibacter terrae TaxID=2586908 RepID=A0A5C8PA14_9HYPH|nr:hypothetical protein [Vineibacter terrae]TXL70636.1 hypothetical protein FHP25_33840 [Vineibacter terrae]HEX2890454.1 hypothetical protein [Vineibacter terrae]